MSGLAGLGVQCDMRGWRLSVGGRYPAGRNAAGFEVSFLEVRTRTGRDLLASVPADAHRLDDAADIAARSLQRQGLIV